MKFNFNDVIALYGGKEESIYLLITLLLIIPIIGVLSYAMGEFLPSLISYTIDGVVSFFVGCLITYYWVKYHEIKK